MPAISLRSIGGLCYAVTATRLLFSISLVMLHKVSQTYANDAAPITPLAKRVAKPPEWEDLPLEALGNIMK